MIAVFITEMVILFKHVTIIIIINLTPDEQKALKPLKRDKNIVILPADKWRVTVVMDKTDYNDKMDSLVDDKQTYEVLKRDPTPAMQRKLNNKLLTLKKTAP